MQAESDRIGIAAGRDVEVVFDRAAAAVDHEVYTRINVAILDAPIVRNVGPPCAGFAADKVVAAAWQGVERHDLGLFGCADELKSQCAELLRLRRAYGGAPPQRHRENDGVFLEAYRETRCAGKQAGFVVALAEVRLEDD